MIEGSQVSYFWAEPANFSVFSNAGLGRDTADEATWSTRTCTTVLRRSMSAFWTWARFQRSVRTFLICSILKCKMYGRGKVESNEKWWIKNGVVKRYGLPTQGSARLYTPSWQSLPNIYPSLHSPWKCCLITKYHLVFVVSFFLLS